MIRWTPVDSLPPRSAGTPTDPTRKNKGTLGYAAALDAFTALDTPIARCGFGARYDAEAVYRGLLAHLIGRDISIVRRGDRIYAVRGDEKKARRARRDAIDATLSAFDNSGEASLIIPGEAAHIQAYNNRRAALMLWMVGVRRDGDNIRLVNKDLG